MIVVVVVLTWQVVPTAGAAAESAAPMTCDELGSLAGLSRRGGWWVPEGTGVVQRATGSAAVPATMR